MPMLVRCRGLVLTTVQRAVIVSNSLSSSQRFDFWALVLARFQYYILGVVIHLTG